MVAIMATQCLFAILLATSANGMPSPTPTPSPSPTPTPTPTTTMKPTTTTKASTTQPTTTTVYVGQTQTITQEATFSSLDGYTNAANFASQFKNSIKDATGMPSNKDKVTVSIASVAVKATTTLNAVITDSSKLQTAVASHANVNSNNVTIELSRRRLTASLEEEQERRLATTQVSITIETPNTGDVITKAKSIKTQLADNTGLATAISTETGVTVTATAPVITFKVTVTTTVQSSSTISQSSMQEKAAAIGSVLGVTTAVDCGCTTTVKMSRAAPWSSGYIFVAFVSTFWGITNTLG